MTHITLFEIIEALHRAGRHTEREALRLYVAERDTLIAKNTELRAVSQSRLDKIDALCAENDALRAQLDAYERDPEIVDAENNHGAPDLPFTVAAGKYDDNELNTKYVDSFATLDEAIDAYDEVCGYPWAEIEYKGALLQVLRTVD
jgi:hypothetical protein